MSNARSKLRAALQSREVSSVTQALSELAEKLGYQLKPPYTEVMELKAKQEENRFAIHFSAKLHLHYSRLQTQNEGLVFTLQFGGEAYADSPNPPVDELFAAGVVDSLFVYGYGSNWPGQTIHTPDKLTQNLEVKSRKLNRIAIDDFLKQTEA